MKNLKSKILVVAIVLAVPAWRENAMMLALAGLALAVTARSLEQQPAAARLNAPRRKVWQSP